MNRRVLSIAGLALAICIIGGPAARATGNLEVITQGGTAIGNRVWNSASLPIVWRFNDPSTVAGCNYTSASAPAATLQAAIAAGFLTWENDPDSTMTFSYGGTTTTRNVGADGVNVVTFCSTSVFSSGVIASTPTTAVTTQVSVVPGGGCPAGQGSVPGFPAVCMPSGVYPAGTIIDGDIQFNGTTPSNAESFLSTGDPSSATQATKFDVQAVVTHEEGHFFGLSHDPVFQAVMFPFVDDDPFSDGLGQRVLKNSDKATAGHYYPAATYGSNFGSITGFVSLDGVEADGVHVAAIDPNTMLGYTGRFSLSIFEDTEALGTEGPDFAANGAGFYRIDGLPPGNYYVYVEYFDNSDGFTGRLANRYNTTVGNSSVSNGNPTSVNQVPNWLGFIPALTEFYDAAESGNGGDGVAAGTAADNSDASSLVPVVAGTVTTGIDIAINIEPVNGQTAVNRQNPTTRTILANDNFQGTDVNTAFLLNGGGDDYYAIRYLAASLPTPPYNIAEGQWVRFGKNDQNYNVMLTFSDPNNSLRPAFNDPIVSSAGRFLSGGPAGKTDAGDVVDVRDQWNVTVNTSRDVWIVMNQPPSAAGISFLTQGYFILVTRTSANMARIGRTLITQDGGATWGTLTADVLYDLALERTPPVLITGATPASADEGTTLDVTVNGTGFLNGAVCDFGPNITVNTSTFLSAAQVRCNITIAVTGATANRGVNVKIINPNVIVPNVSRVFTVTPLVDTDGDGVGNALDCAPLDNTLKHAATEVLNDTVTLSGPSTFYSWDSQDALNGTGTAYDVVTGLVSDLLASRNFSAAGCGMNDLPDSPFTDPNPTPAPGNARYFLVRARNICNVGNATYGDSSLVADPRDALDAGAPCP